LTIAALQVGQKMNIKVIRDGREITFPVIVAERKDNVTVATERSGVGHFGLAAQEITAEMAKQLGIPRDGVIVTEVQEGSPADEVGIQPQDVIVQVNRVRIHSMKDYTREITKSC
jgi:Trypsin-like serine proteases, typically periplasmic, contain C-terminal PDZ domain